MVQPNFSFAGVLKDDQGATITSGVSLITTNDSSNGGDFVESIDSIKYLALVYVPSTVQSLLMIIRVSFP